MSDRKPRAGGWIKTGNGMVRSKGSQLRSICIAFDPETFEYIHKIAKAGKVSFNEQVRTYVEWGIELETEAPKATLQPKTKVPA